MAKDDDSINVYDLPKAGASSKDNDSINVYDLPKADTPSKNDDSINVYDLPKSDSPKVYSIDDLPVVPAYYVFDCARLGCTMGDMEAKLEVTDPQGQGYMCGKSAANIKDCKSLINIPSFGRCQSMANPSVAAATASNFGVLQPMPCIVPNIVGEWQNGTDPKFYIRGYPVLMSDAKLICGFTGIIEVKETYSDEAGTGAMGLFFDEEIFGNDPDRGPGTRYINNKGQLLYERRDGVAGRILIVLDNQINQLIYRLRRAKAYGDLNRPNNDDLLIGLTGEQYTNSSLYSTDDTFKQAYSTAYNRQTASTLWETFVSTLELSGGGVEVEDENVQMDGLIRKQGIKAGTYDRDKGLIDLYNPTARINGGPLIEL